MACCNCLMNILLTATLSRLCWIIPIFLVFAQEINLWAINPESNACKFVWLLSKWLWLWLFNPVLINLKIIIISLQTTFSKILMLLTCFVLIFHQWRQCIMITSWGLHIVDPQSKLTFCKSTFMCGSSSTY